MQRLIRGCSTVLAACCLALLSADAQGQQAGDQAKLDAAFLKGQELTKAGKYNEASAQFQIVVELTPGVYGANSTHMAAYLDWLASSFQDAGQYAKAEPLYLRSLQIYEAKLGKDHPDVARILNNLASLYEAMGQHAKAEPLYQRSLKIREAKLGQDHLDVANSLHNLAGVYQAMGQHARAEPLYQRSLQINEAKLGKDHPGVAIGLNNLANLYHDMGQHAKAEPLYQRSLQIKEAKLGKDHPSVATSLHSQAVMYVVLGQYAKAEPLFQRSLEIWEAKLGQDHPLVAAGLSRQGGMYLHMGQYAKAEPLLQRSLQIREAKLGKDHRDVASSLINLGMLYRSMEQYAKAEPLFQRSLEIREAKLGKDHRDVASSLNNLGMLYHRMGQYAKAVPMFQRGIEIHEADPQVGGDHHILHNYAVLAAAQERWLEAATLFERSRRRHVSLFQNTLPILSAREQLNLLDMYKRTLAASLSLAFHRRQDTKIVELSAAWVLNGKGLTQDALAQSLLRKPGQDKTGANEPDRWIELDKVRQAIPGDAVLVEVARFGLYDFNDKQNKVLPPRYAVWLIPPAGQGDVEIIDLGPAEPIEQAVAAFRRAIGEAPATIRTEGEPDAEKKAQKTLQELSRLVLEPMRAQIGSAKQWLVSPDAALWLVPWAALPLADGSYAVEKHTIRYLISGRELVQTAAAGKPGRARIIADPDFDLAPAAARAELNKLAGKISPASELRAAPTSLLLPNVQRLPGTKAEADAIKPKLDQYIGQDTYVYQDRQALEGIIKRVRKPGVLVLSTHGFFLADQEVASGGDLLASRGSGPVLTKDGKPLENPLLRCGLLLAGCNRRAEATQPDDDDGILTGAEIVGLDLQGTALVVLSACETGVGQVNVGEGVAGLRQAFQLAGARSVLATLWQIPDIETARLMSDFFGHLADKKGNAEALRQAQLAMIKARRERNGAAHPFFWAAFTLTGQGR